MSFINATSLSQVAAPSTVILPLFVKLVSKSTASTEVFFTVLALKLILWCTLAISWTLVYFTQPKILSAGKAFAKSRIQYKTCASKGLISGSHGEYIRSGGVHLASFCFQNRWSLVPLCIIWPYITSIYKIFSPRSLPFHTTSWTKMQSRGEPDTLLLLRLLRIKDQVDSYAACLANFAQNIASSTIWRELLHDHRSKFSHCQNILTVCSMILNRSRDRPLYTSGAYFIPRFHAL